MRVQCWFVCILLAMPNISQQMEILPMDFFQRHRLSTSTPEPPLPQLLDNTGGEYSNWDIADVLHYEDIDANQFGMDVKAALERYTLHAYARPWFDAASICWREGGRLATPIDEADARTLGLLVDVLAKANVTNTEMRDFMHVGVHNLEKKGYVSTTEGDKATYTPWQEGEEFKTSEQTCGVILTNGRFMLQLCSQSLPFACDKTPPEKKVIALSKNEMIGGEGYKFLSDGRPYRLHLQPLPWLEAAKTCEAEGGRLAVPQSDRQAGLLAGLVFSCGNLFSPVHDPGLFIGINDIAVEGQWRSIDGSEYHGQLWKNGNPKTNRSANCAAILSTAKYIDVSCREPKPFICELTHVMKDNPQYVEVDGIGHYAIHVSGKYWLNAAAQCRSENASLAVPNSKEEADAMDKMQKEVAKHFPGFDTSQVFIGVHDIDRVGRWRTLDGQRLSDIGFNEWYAMNGNLIRGGAICVGLRDGKLITLKCAEEHMYICEKPLQETSSEIRTKIYIEMDGVGL